MSNFPYPGLRTFKREETDIFFGRDELSNQLIERLGETHFLAVVGLSGCGKSSLVRTGLLAGLERGLLPSAGIRWRIAECTPSTQPFFRLASALLADNALKKEYIANSDNNINEIEFPNFLEARLRSSPLSLNDILEDSPLPSNTNLLLIIDQFEELFRYYRRGQTDDSARFVRLLLDSCEHQNVYVVITMRSEFIGDCTLFHNLPEAINQGLFLTPRLTRDQLHETIEGPAKVFGAEIESTLTNLLLNEMSPNLDEKGNVPDKLPILQHALMRMWKLAKNRNPNQINLTLKDYKKVGKLDSSLSNHADKAYEKLVNLVVPHEPQKIAEILFRRLCERDSAYRDTRSPAKLSEIVKLAGLEASWRQIIPVINRFRQEGRHFLTPSLNVDLHPDSMIDISHESLIQHWKCLKDWSEEEAKSADIYRRLEDSACLWNKQRAELLSGVELDVALDWYDKEKPTPLWAERYGKKKGKYFDLAKDFLKKSEQEENRKQQREKEKRLKKEQEHEEKKQAQQRLKWIQQIAIISVIGLIMMAGLAIWGYGERNQAISAQQQTEKTKLDSQLDNATWLSKFDDYQTSKTVLGKINKVQLSVPYRNTHNLLNWFNNFMSSESEYVYVGANAALYSVAINGKYLAVSGENGTLVIFDTTNGKLLHNLQGHNGHVKAVVFHPQGKWLASAGYDKQIIFWSPITGKQIQPALQTSDKIWALAVSPDGRYLASGGKDEAISLWDTNTGKLLRFHGHTDDVRGLAFSSNGKLASASYDKTVRLWDIKTGKELRKFVGHTNKIYTVAFSPNNEWLVSGGEDEIIRLWEVNYDKVKSLSGHKNKVIGVSFSNDGKYVISSSNDLTLRVWDVKSGVTVQVLQGHTAGVNGVTVSSTEKIFSVSDDTTVRSWALPQQKYINFSTKQPLATAIAPDGNSVAVGFKDGTLHLYSLPKTQLLWETIAHSKEVRRIAFNEDGSLLATASSDTTAKLWQDGKLVQTFTGHKKTINAITFIPKKDILATASFDGQVGLFTIGTEQKSFYKPHDGKDVNSITSNGSKLLSTGDEDVRLWNINEEPPLESYFKATDLIWSALSSDGKQTVNVGRDQLVHVYPTKSINSLKGHRNTVYKAIFSPDNKQVATVSSDATLRVWDLRDDGMELFSLRLPTNSGKPVPLKDFDFSCVPEGNCWIAVPLINSKKLMLYRLENIYVNTQ